MYMNICTVDVQENWRGNQKPTSNDNIQTWETQRKTTTDKTYKNTQTTHKQHGLPMEREWTQVFRKSKQFLPIAIHPPAAMHVYEGYYTYTCREGERIKTQKTSRNGKKLKVWNKQPQCSDCIYIGFFYSCTGMTINTFFLLFRWCDVPSPELFHLQGAS